MTDKRPIVTGRGSPTPQRDAQLPPAPERSDPLRAPKGLRRFAKAKPRPLRPGERDW
jgi:hypothetical protein